MVRAAIIALGLLTMSVPASAQWQIEVEQDSMTDAFNARADLEGDAGRISLFCTSGERPILTIESNVFLGGPARTHDWRDIWIRFDDTPAVKYRWKYSNNYAATPSTDALSQFLQVLVGASRLRVRLVRYDNALVDVDFDVSGASALMQMDPHCRDN